MKYRSSLFIFVLIICLISGTQLFAQATESWYIRRTPPEPWTWAPILNSNITEMDEVFGIDEWHSAYFDDVDPLEAFGPISCFIFLEGGDDHADELNIFLSDNITLIEDWVFAGGSLFLNAAPNEGGNIDFGFGGVTLVYPSYTSTGTAVDLAHPIFNGPYTPVGSSWNGPYFGHSTIDGPDIIPLITNEVSNVVMAEKSWGAGKVIFGGMTVTAWHDPIPDAVNMRLNTMKYLASYAFLDFSYGEEIYCSYDTEIYFPIFSPGADTGTFSAEPTGLIIDGITGAIDIDASIPGTYSISNNFLGIGCKSDSAQTTIIIAEPAEANAGDDVTICKSDTVQLDGSGGEEYLWLPSIYLDNALSEDPYVEGPLSDMYYNLVITDINGCSDTDDVSVFLFPDPIIDAGEDQYILLGSYVMITANGGESYIWTPEESLSDATIFNPLSYATENTTYYVYGTDENGCTGMDSVHVILRDDAIIGIPNAFSPNSDGINDFFQAIAIGTVASFDLTIYNRWGKQVYQNNSDITKGWDGTFEAKIQPIGSYIYTFNALDGEGTSLNYQGNFTLVR